MQKTDNAFVLDVKPYRESSALVKLFTVNSGVLSGVMRSVYSSSKKSQVLMSALQVGCFVQVTYKPSIGLQSIYQIDLLHSLKNINTKNYLLISYCNELLCKLLPEGAACTQSFSIYQNIHENLSGNSFSEAELRLFEFTLLDELGFEFDWFTCFLSGEEISPDAYYQFDPRTGFSSSDSNRESLILGQHIQSIAGGRFDSPPTLGWAKKIFRRLIQLHLGNRTLKSRKMYLEMFH